MYLPEFTTLFPRMYRQGEGNKYKVWSGYQGNTNKPLPGLGQINKMLQQNYTDRSQQYQALMNYANNAGVPDNNRKYFREIATDLAKDGLFYPLLERTCNTCFNTSLAGCIGGILCGIFLDVKMIFKVMDLTGGASKILEGNWLSGIRLYRQSKVGSSRNPFGRY